MFAAIHAKLPSVNVVKNTVSSFRGELAYEKPVKNTTAFEARKKDLDRELEAARKEREAEKQKIDSKQLTLTSAPQHIAIQKKASSILSGMFGKSADSSTI